MFFKKNKVKIPPAVSNNETDVLQNPQDAPSTQDENAPTDTSVDLQNQESEVNTESVPETTEEPILEMKKKINQVYNLEEKEKSQPEIDAVLGDAPPRETEVLGNSELALENVLDETDADKRAEIEAEKIKNQPKILTPQKEKKKPHSKSGKRLKLDTYGNPIKKRSGDMKRGTPVDEVKPSEVKHNEISFLGSIGQIEAVQRQKMKQDNTNWDTVEGIEKPEEIIETNIAPNDYTPKIRSMEHSTRAKEERALEKSRNKKKAKKQVFTYPKESAKQSEIQPEQTTAPVEIQEEVVMDLPFFEDAQAKTFIIPKVQKEEEVYTTDQLKDLGTRLLQKKNKIEASALLLLILAILSTWACLSFELSWNFLLHFTQEKSYMLFQTILALLASAVGYNVFRLGFSRLFSRKSDTASMFSLCMVTGLIACVLGYRNPILLSSGNNVLSAPLLCCIPMCIWGFFFQTKLQSRRTRHQWRMTKKVIKANENHAVFCIENERHAEQFTRGTLGTYPILATTQKAEHMRDFEKTTAGSDLTDSVCKWFVPCVFVISLLICGLVTLMREDSLTNSAAFFFSLLSAFLTISMGISFTFVCQLPLMTANETCRKSGGALLSYQAVEEFSDVNSIMITSNALFPKGSLILTNMKSFSNVKLDEAILLAASISQLGNSVLYEVFRSALQYDSDYPAIEEFAFDNEGYSGWYQNKRILCGSREMMVRHHVEGLPTARKESEFAGERGDVIYLSISGNISVMFVIEMRVNKAVKYWLDRLDEKDIFIMIRNTDSFITEEKLSKLFRISEDLFHILPQNLNGVAKEEMKPCYSTNSSLLTSGRFTGLVQLLMAIQDVKKSSHFGLILQSVFSIVGLVLIIIFSILSVYGEFSAFEILLYHLVTTLFIYSIQRLWNIGN